MTKTFFRLIPAFILAVCILCYLNTSRHQAIRYTTFQTPGGWGYNILVHDTVFIHQESIPALALNHSFTTREQASGAAKLVVRKINHHQAPTLTEKEVLTILDNN